MKLKYQNRINNILWSDDFHIYYQPSFLNYGENEIEHLLKDDLKRISLNQSPSLTNPKYLFVSLSIDETNNVTFSIFNEGESFKWSFNEMCLIHNGLYLNICDDKLVVSDVKSEWEICNNSFIKNVKKQLYITCDINYKIALTKNINDAIAFHIINNSIHYFKSKLRVDFEINNIINKVDVSKIYSIKNTFGKRNIGILLAAGLSSRFESSYPKQLYEINGIPIIMYSVYSMIDYVEDLIIVTNTKYFYEIQNLTSHYKNIKVIINDVNCRLESISCGLELIKNTNTSVNNIIIHDAARPFIRGSEIKNLLNSCNKFLYSQYYLELVNGLYKKGFFPEFVDRNGYLEICTPIAANFELYYFIFSNYIKLSNRITHEHISILDLMKIQYCLIPGLPRQLRKITYFNDVADY
jgi:2-C-methyl-D-erythritol 4-phosphate cytidylyltransferase